MVLIFAGAAVLAPAYGQERAQGERDRPRQGRPRGEHVPEAGDSGSRPQFERDFIFPDPDRPWGRPRYLDRRRHRSRPYPQHNRRRHYYYDDYTYRFGIPHYDDPYDYDTERAYRQGISDGRNFERFDIQAERGLTAYRQAMAAGHAAFAATEYGFAARQFSLAAALNQGDPTARICTAHAHVAVGDYEPAFLLVRRAFELQPKLVYLPMDIRNAYGNRADFQEHLKALHAAAKSNTNRGDLWFLLGYCHYYSNNMKKATEAFATAAKLQPEDELFAQLAELARMSAQRPGKAPVKRESQPGKKEL